MDAFVGLAHMKTAKIRNSFASLIAGLALTSLTSNAGELAFYGQSIDFEGSIGAGCLTVGDAISCSAPLLNVLAGLDENALTKDDEPEKGYVFQTNQGTLKKDFIVVSGGGDAGENDEVLPDTTGDGGEVEDGFKSNDSNNSGQQYFATGNADPDSDNTNETVLGNLSDPDNNGLPDTQDAPGTWDVSISWLLQALTFDDVRHQMLIGFDYNEPQDDSKGTLDYWSLVSIWSSTDDTLDPFQYEIGNVNSPLSSPLDFSTSKEFDSKPGASDFATVNGISCVYKIGNAVVGVTSQPGGNCDSPSDAGFPGATLTEIENAQATNLTEFIAYIPELDALLEWFLVQGYDTISARVLLGCFDNSATDDDTIGSGYLDGAGATTNCGQGGFPDIFLMAGDPIYRSVPDPSSLAIFGTGLLILSWSRRLSKRNSQMK